MPYVDPASVHDPSTGGVAPASWGDAVRDAIEHIARNAPRCSVTHSVNQSIANATTTALVFDTERFDTGGLHSTVSNTSRITVPTGEGGVYLIGANINWAFNNTGFRQVNIELNGATVIAFNRQQAVQGTDTGMSITTVRPLVAGDYIEIDVHQTSGGALNVLTGTDFSPNFFAYWIAL